MLTPRCRQRYASALQIGRAHLLVANPRALKQAAGREQDTARA
jgi:hypothetical protein